MFGLKRCPFGQSLVLGPLLIVVIVAALASTKLVERASAGYRGDVVLESRTEQCNDGNLNWFDNCGKSNEYQYTCELSSEHERKKTRTLMGSEFEEYCFGSIRVKRKNEGGDAWVAGCFLYSGTNGIKELPPDPYGRRIAWVNTGFLSRNPFSRKGAMLAFVIPEDADRPVLIQGYRATASKILDGYIELGELDRDMVIQLRLEQPSTLEQLVNTTQVVRDAVEASHGSMESPSVQQGSIESLALARSEPGHSTKIKRVMNNRPAAEPPSDTDAQEGTKAALITRASRSGSAGTPETNGCPGNLIITGNVRYAEPGCSDGAVYFTKTQNTTCTWLTTDRPQAPHPDATTDCVDLPLRRARVELWSGATYLFATATDGSGDFEFCLNNAPNNPVDLYVVVLACPDGTDEGDACGSLPGEPMPYSVVTITPDYFIYLIDGFFSTAFDVCIGTVHWDIVDRRANDSGAENIYDLLANDAFDYFETTVGWVNDKKLPVMFPDSETAFSAPPATLHFAAGDEQDADVTLRTYAYFLLYELYDHLFPEASPACDSHTWGAPSDVTCAMIHGAAMFLQAACQDDSLFLDTPSPGAPPTTQIDLELPDPPVDGVFDEGAVAASLWDMFDSTNESHDSLAVGLAPIWDLIDAYRPDWFCSFLEVYQDVHGPSAELVEILDTHHVGCGMAVEDSLGSNLAIQTIIDSVVVPNIITGINGDPQETSMTVLEQFPNPFNPTTTIRYHVPSAGIVKLRVYDVFGRQIRSLVSEPKEAGYHTVTWDGTDTNVASVASGVYFLRLDANGKVRTRKIVLLR